MEEKETDIIDEKNKKEDQGLESVEELEPPAPVEEGEKCNYEEALKDLSNIALSGKRILEEDSVSSTSKRIRSSNNEEEEDVAPVAHEVKEDDSEKSSSVPLKDDGEMEDVTETEEAKVRNEDKNPDSNPASSPSSLEELKYEFKRMTRSELENLVLQKMMSYISCESELGALRQKCDYLNEISEKWKAKVQALQKQCQDLNTVMQRYIKDVSNRPHNKDRVAPVRVTRSVGLQVRLPSTSLGTNHSKHSQQQSIGSKTLEPSKTANTTTSLHHSSIKKITNNTSLTVLPVSESKTSSSNCINSINNSKNGSTSSKNNQSVIDLIDLSDEEDEAPKKAALPSKTVRSDITILNKGAERGAGSSNTVIGRASLVPLPNTSLTTVQRGNNLSHAPPSSTFSVAQRHRLIRLSNPVAPSSHPAPLPVSTPGPSNPSWKSIPPKPSLKLSRLRSGIVLSWNLDLKNEHDKVLFYQLFAYQESSGPPLTSLWKKVGDVEAMPLPMACTLTQFMKGNKYHFAIRALDSHNRLGPFSDPSSILLT